MTPVSELPVTVRPKSRKEKNKLASRACRLKKKAQHEANKIKLFGLENEHSKSEITLEKKILHILNVFVLERLISSIQQVKNMILTSYSNDNKQAREEIARNIEKARRMSLSELTLDLSIFLYLRFLILQGQTLPATRLITSTPFWRKSRPVCRLVLSRTKCETRLSLLRGGGHSR
jgi:hypothetical protein